MVEFPEAPIIEGYDLEYIARRIGHDAHQFVRDDNGRPIDVTSDVVRKMPQTSMYRVRQILENNQEFLAVYKKMEEK